MKIFVFFCLFFLHFYIVRFSGEGLELYIVFVYGFKQ